MVVTMTAFSYEIKSLRRTSGLHVSGDYISPDGKVLVALQRSVNYPVTEKTLPIEGFRPTSVVIDGQTVWTAAAYMAQLCLGTETGRCEILPVVDYVEDGNQIGATVLILGISGYDIIDVVPVEDLNCTAMRDGDSWTRIGGTHTDEMVELKNVVAGVYRTYDVEYTPAEIAVLGDIAAKEKAEAQAEADRLADERQAQRYQNRLAQVAVKAIADKQVAAAAAARVKAVETLKREVESRAPVHGTDGCGNWKSGYPVTQTEFNMLPSGIFCVMKKDGKAHWCKKMGGKGSVWIPITACSQEQAKGSQPTIKTSSTHVAPVMVKSTAVVSTPLKPATVAAKPIVAVHNGGVVKKLPPPAVATSPRVQNMPQVSVNINGTCYHVRVVDSVAMLMKINVRIPTYVGLTTDNMTTIRVYMLKPGVVLDLNSPVKTLERQVKLAVPA